MSWDIHRGYTWLKLLQYAYLQRQVSLRKMVVGRKSEVALCPIIPLPVVSANLSLTHDD